MSKTDEAYEAHQSCKLTLQAICDCLSECLFGCKSPEMFPRQITLACQPVWAHHQLYTLKRPRIADPMCLMLAKDVALTCCRFMLQKALEQTAEKSVGLQPLVAQLSKALHQANVEPIGDHA